MTLPEMQSLSGREDFYCHLNMDHITDASYKHAQRFCKVFKVMNLGDSHDLYVQSDTRLLADVFNGFQNIYLKINRIQQDFFQLPD